MFPTGDDTQWIKENLNARPSTGEQKQNISLFFFFLFLQMKKNKKRYFTNSISCQLLLLNVARWAFIIHFQLGRSNFN